MDPTIAPGRHYRKSAPHVHGRHSVQHALGAASRDASHKQIQRGFEKAERVAQVLALAGKTQPVVNHIARLQEIIDTAPAPEITAAFRITGQVQRAEEEARDDCLHDGCTPQELDLDEARVLRVINQSFAHLRAIRAHRRAHG